MPTTAGLSNLSPAGVKRGFDNYRAGQGLPAGQGAEQGQGRFGKYGQYARNLQNSRRTVERENMGRGLKGLTRGGLKHAVGDKAGKQLIAAIDSDTSNFVFAICLVAAIMKDTLDLFGDAMLAAGAAVLVAGGVLLMTFLGPVVGAAAAAIAAVPVVGGGVISAIAYIPTAIGSGLYGGVFIFKEGLGLIIWLLMGWKMDVFRKGTVAFMRYAYWAYQWLMGLTIVVDAAPAIDIVPFESMVVAFGWVMTIFLSMSPKEKEEKQQQKKDQRRSEYLQYIKTRAMQRAWGLRRPDQAR